MNQFMDRVPPIITIGSFEHMVYLFLLIILIVMLISFKPLIRRHVNTVMWMVLLTAVCQRVLSNVYYIFIVGYPIEEALPLYICRMVCLMIIVQCFVRKKWLDQLIFYWGLFAYGSMIYPVDISSPLHITGLTFFILHSLIIMYPLIRYYTSGFIPNLKGAFFSVGAFVIYLPLVVGFSQYVNGNYFYTNNRPFLHDMGDTMYFLVNLVGVSSAFIIIGLICNRFQKK